MQKWFFNEIIHASSSKKKTFFQHSLVNSYIYAKYLYSGEQGLSSDRSMMILRRSSWNYNVKTTLGRRFLNIVDRHFPKNNPLHKIINRHTLELRYSCMPNMKTLISSQTTKNCYQIAISPEIQHKHSTKSVTAEKKINALSKENASHQTESTSSSHNWNTNRFIRRTRDKLQRTLQKPHIFLPTSK